MLKEDREMLIPFMEGCHRGTMEGILLDIEKGLKVPRAATYQ